MVEDNQDDAGTTVGLFYCFYHARRARCGENIAQGADIDQAFPNPADQSGLMPGAAHRDDTDFTGLFRFGPCDDPLG